jgi:ABC-type Zn uptake system ZnuABC Zn-binding protein ZnuA
MNIRYWLYQQPAGIRRVLLFFAVFIFVLFIFLLWYQFHTKPEVHEEALVAAARPRLRVGITHPFLEGMTREIGSSFVTTVRVVPFEEKADDTNMVCEDMDIFFGISDSDGWVKDMCGADSAVAIVFLDTYAQAQEKKIAPEIATTSQSIYTTGYFWLSTRGAKNIARIVAQILSSADGVHKVSYLDNAYAIGRQLDDTYKKVKDQLYDVRKVSLVGWGDGWGALIDEYDGRLKKTIDITYDPSAQSQLVELLYTDMQNYNRPLLLTDATFPLSLFSTRYPVLKNRVAVLDPWGDFSDTWSFAAFVEQNLLRVGQAL